MSRGAAKDSFAPSGLMIPCPKHHGLRLRLGPVTIPRLSSDVFFARNYLGQGLDTAPGSRIYSLCAKIFALRGVSTMAKLKRIHLTRRESQIMEILHRRRRATVEEIRTELPDAPSPSSVRKLLEIMIERGL